MNYFFSLTNNHLKSEITIPKFQNRGNYNKKLKIFSLKILNNNWIASKPVFNSDENFYYIKKDFNSKNEIFAMSEEDIENTKYNSLNFKNNFFSTSPAFRANLRVINSAGGFSSYQSEYPSGMTQRKGNILSQISSLLDPDNDKNILIFKNIYFEPIVKSFRVFIVDIENKEVVIENSFYTNSLNFWEIDKNFIKPSNFFFSEGYLGIPIYFSEKKNNISLEHTHPLQSYIMTPNMQKIIQGLKKNVQTFIKR